MLVLDALYNKIGSFSVSAKLVDLSFGVGFHALKGRLVSARYVLRSVSTLLSVMLIFNALYPFYRSLLSSLIRTIVFVASLCSLGS